MEDKKKEDEGFIIDTTSAYLGFILTLLGIVLLCLSEGVIGLLLSYNLILAYVIYLAFLISIVNETLEIIKNDYHNK